MTARERSSGWRLLLLLGLLVPAVPAPAQESASEARMRKDVTFLASDECEGRGVYTKGIDRAADYIAAEFKKAGLKPGKGDSYFQPFTINRDPATLAAPGTLVFKGPQGQTIQLAAGKDFTVQGLSGSGKVADAPLVFAGYGLTADQAKYDDYQGLDVKGKVVIALRGKPRAASHPTLITPQQSGLENKAATAQQHQAAAVLVVNDDLQFKRDGLTPFSTSAFSTNPAAVPFVQVSHATVDRIVQSGLGTGLVELEQAIHRDLKPHSAPLKGWTVSLETRVDRKIVVARNVVGVLEGSGPLANETVIVGAHYDHLGFGPFGSMAKTDEDRKKLHRGADDNGSGTTAVLELARRFGAMKNREGRRLVFMTFSGEEIFLLGSAHYCNKEPLFPLKDTVFMLNLDMVGRMRFDKTVNKDVLICEGVRTGEGFDALVDKFTAKYNFDLDKLPGSRFNSDHASFRDRGVPVLFYKTGLHVDYHRPTDTVDRLNIPGMKKIVDMAEATLLYFTTVKERPKWTPMKADEPRKGPTLGIQGSGYNPDGDGLIVISLAPDGPAAKAGLKAGDKIVLLAGREIRIPENFNRVLDTLTPGMTYEGTALRKGQPVAFKVVVEMTGK
jgi:hypothetical protein